MTKKVLVTGGSGYIALHCVLELLKKGYHVRASVRQEDKKEFIRSSLSPHVELDDNLEFCLLDLMDEKGWDQAVKDCQYVLHTASPFPSSQPKHEDDLILPAKKGTLFLLKAAHEAKIKRVVLTSSVAAIAYGHSNRAPLTESNWSQLDYKAITPYTKSKTIAEKSAWAYIRQLGPHATLKLSVINPGFVIGPVIGNREGTSVRLLNRMIKGKMSLVPNIGFGLIDVRDVALLHVKAMTCEDAKNERFLCAHEQSRGLIELARILKEHGYEKVSTTCAPNWLIRLLALFNKELSTIVPLLGVTKTFDNSKAKRILQWQPIPFEQSVLDMAKSLEGKDV